MSCRTTQIVVQFRQPPHHLFGNTKTVDANRLVIQVQPAEGIQLQFQTKVPDAGMHMRVTDAYAIMAGLDGIAFPADGAVSVAHTIGRPFEQAHSCCSIKLGGDLAAPGLGRSFAA